MMVDVRIIPCLLLKNKGLVKTIKFRNPTYIGDPINAVKIFNEKEVDELIFLDITATIENRPPPIKYISKISEECFMPLTYGGGIKSLSDIKEILKSGAEKVAVNSYAIENPSFIKEASNLFGSQSIVVSIDAQKKNKTEYEVLSRCGTKPEGIDPVELARRLEEMGAGEILINSIDKDGTMEGYDYELIKRVSESVNIPVIACGGAGRLQDFAAAVKIGKSSAVAAGSLFVYYGKKRAVLINYPSKKELESFF